jgi:hypothetical protein
MPPGIENSTRPVDRLRYNCRMCSIIEGLVEYGRCYVNSVNPALLHARACAPLICIVVAVLAGCVSTPSVDEMLQVPAPHLLPEAPEQIVDERARFRDYFCTAMAANPPDESMDCEDWLHRLPDESEYIPSGSPARKNLQVLFVTGAFSECFGETARPFVSAIEDLATSDDEFGTIVVGGRSGPKHNALQIAEFIDSWELDGDKPLVLFGYSKGINDILEFLVDYPKIATNVSAVVSLAGSVGGSRIADRYDSLYDVLFSHLPTSHCEKGDGEVVHSLRTEVREAFLAENSLPQHLHYYSVAAFTTRERMARALVPAWKTLLDDSRRNDGQLIPVHALLPNSSLLAYLNADHWAVAMRLEVDHEFVAERPDARPFPQTALLKAILRLVGEDLASSPDPHPQASEYAKPGRSAQDPPL